MDKVHRNSSLLFVRNTALNHGGAIYVELSTPYDYILSHSCFVRYYLDDIFPNKWNTNFTFINNSVIASYNAIFANILRPCLNFYVEKPCEHIFLYDPPFYYQPLLPNHIATSPLLFTFAGNDSTLLYIVPGEVYDCRYIYWMNCVRMLLMSLLLLLVQKQFHHMCHLCIVLQVGLFRLLVNLMSYVSYS